MKYLTTIKRLEREGFLVHREIRDSVMNPGTTYEDGFLACLPDGLRVIEGSKNGGDTDTVATLRVRRFTDHDDSLSDYFAGTWCDTVKRAIELARN